jgi:hypothetical protein
LAKPGLTIDFNFEPLLDTLYGLRRPGLDRSVALALVDTAKAANVKAASAIAKHTGLRVATIKPRLFYDPVPVGRYYTHVRSSQKLIPMINFRARQVSTGVRASKPWGKTQVFKSAFITTAGSHRGVFRRVGKPRLPIREMMGPSIHGSFAQPNVVAIVESTIKARLPVLLARRIKAEQRRGRR